MTEEPTKEQIQWFWEQCGFKYQMGKRWKQEEWFGEFIPWECCVYPDGTEHSNSPSIDLNNLFKYAVPKLDQATKNVTLNGWITDILVDNEDPALALFRAIYKAFGGKE